ncbi:FadR/GntR family transcriptional regulator [Pelagibacterium sp.]|uniref:FadR/GntR family transcriptional regulator n=1 Tax=Pelagibacterium sp. TaxID=1967288 RepID=UPI003BAC8171
MSFVTAGRLKPGDKLPSERDLAERFSVSRPTVREAMRALSVLGVLEVRHGGGAFVTALDATELLKPLNFFLSLSDVSVEKLYDARMLIEGELCALAADNADEALCAELDAMIGRQVEVMTDIDAYLALDSAFHERMAVASGNPFLTRAAQSMNVLGIEFRRASAEAGQAQRQSIEDHRTILKALRAGDSDAARAAMRDHMRQVYTTTRRALDNLPSTRSKEV